MRLKKKKNDWFNFDLKSKKSKQINSGVSSISTTVNKIIKKIALIIGIAFLPTMLFLLILFTVVFAVWKFFNPDSFNTDVVNNLMSTISLETTPTSKGDSGGFMESVLNSVSTILYLFFIRPILWLLGQMQEMIYFMGAGKLTDKLLFGTENSWMGIPAAFWVCIGIAIALAMLCVSIRLIEIMMTHVKDKGQKFKKVWLNLFLAIIAIPAIPVAFIFFNYVINTIPQTIINNGYLSTKDIGLFIFNSSFDNGMHHFTYVPVSWTFDDSLHFNYLICLFSETFMIYILLLINLFLFWRTFELFVLYVISPVVVVSCVSDEGRRFNNWKNLVIHRFIAFAIVYLAYNVFLNSMTLFVEIASQLPNNATQPIFVLIGIFSSGMVVVKSPQLLSSVLGGEVAITDSLGYLIGLSTLSKGLAFGTTAMLVGKQETRRHNQGNFIQRSVGALGLTLWGVAKSTTIASAVVSAPTTVKGVGQGFKNAASGLGNYIKDSTVKGWNFGKPPTDK